MDVGDKYKGDLQERLSALSMRTKCPTRQENGQRYLGPPIDWTSSPPLNSEVFISKLPVDCFEDEIYDFCTQAGTVYLIRLMINFENENRGFCFVTFASPTEANAAVRLLPQRPLRGGLYVHAEISLNNCTLRVYGLNYRWSDAYLKKEIRTNLEDVVDVTVRRNDVNHTVMVTTYFETHQKAAIARRKLSQIANSRWGRNVKVFLWSKKLQNRKPNRWGNNFEMKNEFWHTKRENYPSKNVENFDRENIRFNSENAENVGRHNLHYSPENSYCSNFKNVGEEMKVTSSSFNLWSPEPELTVNRRSGIEFSKNDNFCAAFLNRGNNNAATESKFELAESNYNLSPEARRSNGSETPTVSPGSSFANSSPYSPMLDRRVRCPLLSADGHPSAYPKSKESNVKQSTNEWNLCASEYDVLDLWSPFDHPFDCLSEMFKTTSDMHKKQIEIILKEAIDALDSMCFEEQ